VVAGPLLPFDTEERTHPLEQEPRAWQRYPEAQLVALEEVVAALRAKYGDLPLAGHDEVAVPRGRKLDPGPAFPRERFGMEVLR